MGVTYVRLLRAMKPGLWHVVDPATRPRYYSSGQALCGVGLYVADRFRRRETTEPPIEGQPRCAKCARLTNHPNGSQIPDSPAGGLPESAGGA